LRSMLFQSCAGRTSSDNDFMPHSFRSRNAHGRIAKCTGDFNIIGFGCVRHSRRKARTAWPRRPSTELRSRPQGRGCLQLPSTSDQFVASTRSSAAAWAKARKSRSRVRRGMPLSIQIWAMRASPSRAFRPFANTFARSTPALSQ
jgi:hypothetical protein